MIFRVVVLRSQGIVDAQVRFELWVLPAEERRTAAAWDAVRASIRMRFAVGLGVFGGVLCGSSMFARWRFGGRVRGVLRSLRRFPRTGVSTVRTRAS